MEIVSTNKGWCKSLVVTVNTGVDMEVEVLFDSVSRDSSKYYFEDEESQCIYEGQSVYAASAGMLHARLLLELEEMLHHYGIHPNGEERKDLKAAIQECFRKCESTYGNGVHDTDEYDAVIKFVE